MYAHLASKSAAASFKFDEAVFIIYLQWLNLIPSRTRALKSVQVLQHDQLQWVIFGGRGRYILQAVAKKCG
jgi:hypothetical protein